MCTGAFFCIFGNISIMHRFVVNALIMVQARIYFPLVNSTYKIVKTHFVSFVNPHRAYPGKGEIIA